MMASNINPVVTSWHRDDTTQAAGQFKISQKNMNTGRVSIGRQITINKDNTKIIVWVPVAGQKAPDGAWLTQPCAPRNSPHGWPGFAGCFEEVKLGFLEIKMSRLLATELISIVYR